MSELPSALPYANHAVRVGVLWGWVRFRGRGAAQELAAENCRVGGTAGADRGLLSASTDLLLGKEKRYEGSASIRTCSEGLARCKQHHPLAVRRELTVDSRGATAAAVVEIDGSLRRSGHEASELLSDECARRGEVGGVDPRESAASAGVAREGRANLQACAGMQQKL